MERNRFLSVSAVLSAALSILSAMVFALLMVLSVCVVVSCNAGGEDDDVAGTVYVCTSSGAKVWHCRKNCSALKKCGGSIRETTVGSLGSQYKKPCGMCYKN